MLQHTTIQHKVEYFISKDRIWLVVSILLETEVAKARAKLFMNWQMLGFTN